MRTAQFQLFIILQRMSHHRSLNFCSNNNLFFISHSKFSTSRLTIFFFFWFPEILETMNFLCCQKMCVFMNVECIHSEKWFQINPALQRKTKTNYTKFCIDLRISKFPNVFFKIPHIRYSHKGKKTWKQPNKRIVEHILSLRFRCWRIGSSFCVYIFKRIIFY